MSGFSHFFIVVGVIYVMQINFILDFIKIEMKEFCRLYFKIFAVGIFR